MDREFFINLSFAVYKVTEVFSKEDPLRLKIRSKVNDVLTGLLIWQNNKQLGIKADELTKEIIKNIESLRDYFNSAIKQSMVKPQNFSILEKEYAKIYEELKKEIKKEEIKKEKNKLDKSPTGPERQKKILNFINKKGQVQIKEIENNFSEISRRTIQRDLAHLVNQSLIFTKGDFNQKLYCGMTGGVTEV